MPLGYYCYIHYWKLWPKMDVPESYQLGFVDRKRQRDMIRVESLKVDIIFSELSIFNWKSLIQYTVTGTLYNDGPLMPQIYKMHVAQQYFLTDLHRTAQLSDGVEAEINLLPLLHVERKSNNKDKITFFSITNQIVVNSMHMGENIIRFQCSNHEAIISLLQRK